VGFAYASVCAGNVGHIADKMVTHNWGNKFFHLIAAIFADALDQKTFAEVFELMETHQYDELRERLQEKGTINVHYWVCAFCVNQHNGICHRAYNPKDSHGVPIQLCDCQNAKLSEGPRCEMDKFDDMMGHLKASIRIRSREANTKQRFSQIVAVDVEFQLVTRVWCIAELAEADASHLDQKLILHSFPDVEASMTKINSLDVTEAQASFAADKDRVLSKIADKRLFNKKVRNLICQRLTKSYDTGDLVQHALAGTLAMPMQAVISETIF